MSEKQKSNVVLVILVAAFILTAVALIWVLTRPSSSSPPSPESSDAWERIQASGKIVVGTSADYPPFEYYNSNFQLDGFDIALMREIGQKLGVQVEFRDVVFDGLSDALQLQEIDATIAALTVTNEREQVVDFSQIYFVSEDAIIASQGSAITEINNVNEMAPYRIGVQKSTVYQRWLSDSLVSTGLMPEQNLQVYGQADQAVADLIAGRIDLVVLDLQPAEVAVGLGTVKIVGQGLNRQQMAIAVQNGQGALQGKLNEALTALQNEGRIAQLALDYMNIPPDHILPPPTPVPSTTPVPTATAVPCVDSMKYIQDLNLDDDNMQNPPQMQPGLAFRKGWRVQNVGTCTWETNYYLLYVNGNTPEARMGGQATFVNRQVRPGEMYDMWVDLVSPLQPGVYQGFWAMHNDQGKQFGDRIWVGIEVIGPATATPAATQTPSPNITFTVDRTQINASECVTFSWDVVGANAVYFYASGQPWEPNQVPAQSGRSECPPVTTTYELRVDWPDGRVEIKQITIYVIPVAGAPVIERFTVNPPYEIFTEQCVDISWAVSGEVDSITILRNDEVLWPNAPVNGSRQDCPPDAGEMLYKISAVGPGGTSQQTHRINVIQPTAQPPTNTPVPATPVPIPPQIDRFSVHPEEIVQGDCVSISWSVSGEASLIQIKRDGIVVLDNAGYNGTLQDCLNTVGTITYRIEASNQVGDFAFQEAAVNVQAAPDENLPLVGTDWTLTDYWDGAGAMRAVLSGASINAQFGSDNKVTGSSGCNTYSADYALFTIEGSISIQPPTGTNIACAEPAGIMDQEQTYLNTLPTVTTYQISKNVLELWDAEGRMVLRYEAKPEPQPR
ncbi:MAG: transporter substrate-binding domain-containing protein [Chloroflexi bacterium]|nr:transporter substrate-binding domain-containing protein [Chloroflexota bacterium]